MDINWSDSDSDSDLGLQKPSTAPKPQTQKNPPPKSRKSFLASSDDDDGDGESSDGESSDGDFGLPLLPSQKVATSVPNQKQTAQVKNIAPIADDSDDDWSGDDLPVIGNKGTQGNNKKPQTNPNTNQSDENDDDGDSGSDFDLPSLPSQNPPKKQPQQESTLATKTVNLTKSSKNQVNNIPLSDDDFSEDDAIPQKYAYINTDDVNTAPRSLFSQPVSAMPFGGVAPVLSVPSSTTPIGGLPNLKFSASNATHAPPAFQPIPLTFPSSMPQTTEKAVDDGGDDDDDDDDDDGDDDDEWSDDDVSGKVTQRPLPQQPQPQPRSEPSKRVPHHDKPGLLACGCGCQCTPRVIQTSTPQERQNSRVWRITKYFLDLNNGEYVEENGPICDNCECDEAMIVCVHCDEFLCGVCYKFLHMRENLKHSHKKQHIELFFQKFIESEGQNALNIQPLSQRQAPASANMSTSVQYQATPPQRTQENQDKNVGEKKTSKKSSRVEGANEQGRGTSKQEVEEREKEHTAQDRLREKQEAERIELELLEKKKQKKAEKFALLEQKKLQKEEKLKQKLQKRSKMIVIGDDEGVLDPTRDIFSISIAPAPIVLTKKKTKVVKDLPPSPPITSTTKKSSKTPEPPLIDPPSSSRLTKKAKDVEIEPPSAGKMKKSTSKYTDEDLFGDGPKKGSKSDIVEKKSKSKPVEDDDLFGENTSKKKKVEKKSKSIMDSDDDDDNNNNNDVSLRITQSAAQGTLRAMAKRPQKKSIFDDDDEEEDPSALIDKKFGRRSGGPF
jgi:hypothetical protein